MLGRLVCIILLFVPTLSHAEFRVFRLRIINSETGTERTVTTRFADLHYAGYYPVSRSERITIDQTWMCFERNDYAGTLCPAPSAPNETVPDLNPASPRT